MNLKPKIAVFGGGSWATTIVKMLCKNLEEVVWYMRNESAIDHIKKKWTQSDLYQFCDI